MKTARVPLIFSALALVISLTGAGAYAASQVNGSTIMNGSIGVAKLTPKAVKQLQGKRGERGWKGDAGLNGSAGLTGSPGLTGAAGATGVAGGFDPKKVTYVSSSTTYIAPGDQGVAFAFCPVGTKAVGGGFSTDYFNPTGTSAPSADGAAWIASVWNDMAFTIEANAYAVCAAA